MNDDEIDIPITEEKMCSVLGINDEPEHKQTVSEEAMKASITNVDASVADIDDDLLADAALPVPDHMPEEDHFCNKVVICISELQPETPDPPVRRDAAGAAAAGHLAALRAAAPAAELQREPP
ncbi:hypothetical protein D1007_29793 [Hordeum vulgare]|nr:hypothetical protein D1007_29793 [Hordeum vulgare]